MNLKGTAKIVLFSYLPVVIGIYVMILVRAQDLANETINAGLEPSFFSPVTAADAIISGFIIWTFGALLVALLAVGLYAAMRRYFKATPIQYFITTSALGVLLAASLFISKNPYALEGAFETLACGIGFGILVPIFWSEERNIELYGRD